MAGRITRQFKLFSLTFLLNVCNGKCLNLKYSDFIAYESMLKVITSCMHVNIVIADALIKSLNLEKERENRVPDRYHWGPEV